MSHRNFTNSFKHQLTTWAQPETVGNFGFSAGVFSAEDCKRMAASKTARIG